MIYYSMLLRPNVCFFIELIVLCLIKMLIFLGSPIGFVDKCIFLGFSSSRDILNRYIQSSINTFNRKRNEVRLDFPILNSEIKSKLIFIFCMDLYGCSLWNFGSNYVETFYTAWRKAIRAIWK